GRREVLSPAQTMLAGLGRVLYNEVPTLRCRLIDLSPEPTAEEMRSLVEELGAEDNEDEVALRGEAPFVHRYYPNTQESGRGVEGSRGRANVSSAPPEAYRLEVPRFGVLDKLNLRAVERRSPGAGLVEIQVYAAALNFSDVMKALGLYPGLPDGP